MKSERVNGLEVGYKVQAGDLFATVDLYHSELYDFGTTLLAGANPAFGAWTPPATVPVVQYFEATNSQAASASACISASTLAELFPDYPEAAKVGRAVVVATT